MEVDSQVTKVPCFNCDVYVAIQDNSEQIPLLVVKCVTTLERNDTFMCATELYKKPGNSALIEKLIKEVGIRLFEK